ALDLSGEVRPGPGLVSLAEPVKHGAMVVEGVRQVGQRAGRLAVRPAQPQAQARREPAKPLRLNGPGAGPVDLDIDIKLGESLDEGKGLAGACRFLPAPRVVGVVEQAGPAEGVA